MPKNIAPCTVTGEPTETLLPDSEETLSMEGFEAICREFLAEADKQEMASKHIAPCAVTGEQTETILPESETTLSTEGFALLCEAYLAE